MAKNSAASLLTSVDSLFTTQEERDIATQPRVQEIPVDHIDDFPNHPFKVRMDDSMMEMADSVKQHGILVPAIVRPKGNGHYEMVAGHRRKLACTLIAKLQLPCIVRELTDEEATIIMVDSNLQREQLLPSEKAFAYKMKLDAMKRQGQRTDLTSRPLGEKLLSVDQLSNETPDRARQIHRYIRTLRQNLKTVEQKITNIVNIIANTGSAALVTQLTQLEREKELLDVQIQEEERSTEESELDEEGILTAFRQAQKMFHNGTLPQMEQIINLYLDRVVVFPDYVEIHLNNVPTNLLNPSETKDEPALGGLHTFYIEKMSDNILPKYQTGKIGQYGYDILVKLHRKDEKKNKSRRKGHNETQAQIGLGLGESGGAEGNRTPVRKQLGKNFSGRSLLFAFPFPGGNKHPTRIGSFIMRGMGKAYHTHVLRLNHTRARVSGTPGADGRLIRQPGQQ